jgi:hypothetical protein
MNLSSFGGSTQSPQFHAHSARPNAHALNSAGEAGELARQLGAGNGFDSLSRGGGISAIPRTAAPSTADLLRSAPQSIRTSATDAYDKAASFSSYSEHNETEFSLELRTREGDVVALNYRQLDYRSSAQSSNGASVNEQALERMVSMSVTGDLSDAEFAAIDRMLAQVTAEAASFFEGDLLGTAARLTSLDFDSEQLASFALDFTRTSQIQLTQVYTDSSQSLSDLASRDSGVASLLEMLAATQRRLMEEAKVLFDAPSAAKFARSLIPELFSFGDENKASAV